MSAPKARANFLTWPTPTDRVNVSRRIASLLVSHRTGKEAPMRGQRTGSIARRSLYKAALGDGRIFESRREQSATRTKFILLLDCSGSMRGERFSVAAQAVWDFALAVRQVPTASAEVWGHTTGHSTWQKPENRDDVAPHPDASMLASGEQFVRLVEFANSSTTVQEYSTALMKVELRGNEDGFALEAMTTVANAGRKPGERIVYVLFSDGQPIYVEGYAKGALHTKTVVDSIRRTGDAVVGVSVSPSLNSRSQETMYGKGGFVAYGPDLGKVVRDFAQVAGRYLR